MDQSLTQDRLRACSQRQIGLLTEEFDGLDLDPSAMDRDRSVPLEALGGFLALNAPDAPDIANALAARGVNVDSRGTVLRVGPAPYLTDGKLREAMGILGEIVT